MNTDIRVPNAALDLHLHAGRCGEPEFRVNRVHLRWTGPDERERHRVLTRIAALQVSSAAVRRRRRRVVPMGGRPVMVLRMIVIGVGVGVQQRHHAGRRHQRRDEKQRQHAVHPPSLWDRPG